jgi:hypothetical protein
MAAWTTLSINFDPFAPLIPPLQAALQILEVVQAILEVIFEIIEIFLLGLLSPILALIALLLAAIRAIINQIAATGFAILLIYPNFNAQDFNSVLASVSGAYPAFQSKVFAKFYDQSDIERPMYPAGSAVAMLILYIGVSTPGDLLGQLFALLNFLKHPLVLTGVPAPVELTVAPVFQSGDAVAQFSDLFSSSQTYNNQLTLSWRMPNSPNAVNSPSFISALTSFVGSFQFPNFVIERDTAPIGTNVPILVPNSISNTAIMPLLTKYSFPTPTGMSDLREVNGNVYRDFAKKIPITSSQIVFGDITGQYQYTDTDPALKPGTTYYYRVRAYFGNPSAWLSSNAGSLANNPQTNPLIVFTGNRAVLNYGSGVIMGQPSPVSKGTVPQAFPNNFNPYVNINEVVQLAALLNFELPFAQTTDSATVQSQKTGWGSLGAIGGQMGAVKKAFNNSQALYPNLIFQATCRRVANLNLANMPIAVINVLAKMWNTGSPTLAQTVDNVLGAPGATNPSTVSTFTGEILPAGASGRPGPATSWTFPGITNPNSPSGKAAISTYLALESTYVAGQPLTGPLPTLSPFLVNGTNIQVNAATRQIIAQFIQTVLSASANVGYLSWYSITLGDLFPALLPFIYDLEQFLLALMKALASILAEIKAILDTLLQKIQQIENIIVAIIQLLELLNITLSLSILGYSSSNGSVDDLAQALLASTNVPNASPYGLHSGIVMTFGGPGAGFVAAFDALAFILSAGQL